jgi:hypothetical protein
VTKKTPRPTKEAGRKRRQITVVSANKPDPAIAAKAIMPLLLDFVRRERAKLKESTDNQEK